jgi:hypothetical protein
MVVGDSGAGYTGAVMACGQLLPDAICQLFYNGRTLFSVVLSLVINDTTCKIKFGQVCVDAPLAVMTTPSLWQPCSNYAGREYASACQAQATLHYALWKGSLQGEHVQ